MTDVWCCEVAVLGRVTTREPVCTLGCSRARLFGDRSAYPSSCRPLVLAPLGRSPSHRQYPEAGIQTNHSDWSRKSTIVLQIMRSRVKRFVKPGVFGLGRGQDTASQKSAAQFTSFMASFVSPSTPRGSAPETTSAPLKVTSNSPGFDYRRSQRQVF